EGFAISCGREELSCWTRSASAASIRALSSAVTTFFRRGSAETDLAGAAGAAGGALTSWTSGDACTRCDASDFGAGTVATATGAAGGAGAAEDRAEDPAEDVVTSSARPSLTTGSVGSSISCFSYDAAAGTGGAPAEAFMEAAAEALPNTR